TPNRGVWILEPTNVQNGDELTLLLHLMQNVPLQHDHVRGRRYSLRNIVWRLVRAYHSAPLMTQSLPPCAVGMRQSLRSATRIAPHSTDKWGRPRLGFPTETVRSGSARSLYHESRIDGAVSESPKK